MKFGEDLGLMDICMTLYTRDLMETLWNTTSLSPLSYPHPGQSSTGSRDQDMIFGGALGLTDIYMIL